MAQNKGEVHKKSLLFWFSLMSLIFAGFISAAFLILRPLGIAVRNSMTEIRDNLIREVEDFSGLKLRYGSMGPSIFGTLDIRNINLLRADDTSLASVSRIRLFFSLRDLIRGKTNEGFHSVRLDRPILTMDFEKDRELARLFTPNPAAPGSSGSLSVLVPEDFQIRIRNGEWEGSGAPGSFRVRNINLDSSVRRERIVFQGRWNARALLNPGDTPGLLDMFFTAGSGRSRAPFSISMTGRASAEFSLSTGEGSAFVSIPSFTGETFRLQPLSVNCLFKDRRLEIRKVYDRSPADIALVWDTDSKGLSCSFLGENFSPRDLVTLTGAWRDLNPWTALRLSGQAKLESNAGEMEYSMDLRGSLPPRLALGNASFAFSGQGDREQIQINDFHIASPRGDISYEGSIGFEPLSPRGFLSIKNLQLRGDGSLTSGQENNGLSADLYITSRQQEINIFGENFSSGSVNLSALDITIFQEEGGLNFACSSLRFRNVESYETVRLSSFTLQGSMDYEPRRIQASLKLDSFSLQDMADILSPLALVPDFPAFTRDVIDKISITTEVFFTTDFNHILYNAPRFVTVYEGAQDILTVTSISGTDQRFGLDQGIINWDKGSAGFSGHADFSRPDDISFSVEFSFQELVYYAEGVILDRNSLSLRGSYGLEFFFSSAGINGYSGYAMGERIPIPMKTDSSEELPYAQMSFLFSLRYDSASFWSADIERFEIIDIASPSSGNASLRISGSADQNSVLVNRLVYEDGVGILSGRLSGSWDPDYREFRILLGMNDAMDNERYTLNALYRRDENLDIIFDVEDMQLPRVSRSIQNGSLTGKLRLLWDSAESYQSELDLPLFSLQWQNQMLRGSLSASLDDSELLVQDLKLENSLGLEALMPYFRIDRANGIAETVALAWGTAGGRPVDLSLWGKADFRPIKTWLDYRSILDMVSGSLVLNSAQYDTLAAKEPFNFEFTSVKIDNGHRISLDGGPRNMIRFRYTPEKAGGGNFYAALSAPSPIRGSFTGFIDPKDIDMRVPDLYVDMESLWKFIPPQRDIAFPGGLVNASVHVQGPLRDPEFYGSARVSSLKIQVPNFLPLDIRPIPVNVSIEGNEMRFGPVSASVGTGTGIVSAWFQFEQWIPDIFSLDIVVPQETPVPVDFDIGGIVVKGSSTGHLNLAMEDLIFRVTGDLTAQNTAITLNSAEFTGQVIQDNKDRKVTNYTDVMVRIGRRVEFFWPTAEWPILQAYADQGAGMHIINDASSLRFSVQGDVKLRSGELFYLERNFYIREGTLFLNENETRIEPRISARAEIRDRIDEGPVTISIIIDNAPLQSFTPRFESNPPLSQLEILSLLGQSQGIDLSDPYRDPYLIAYNALDVLTQFVVLRNLQREVRNFLGLDMFSLRTRVLQNVFFSTMGIQAPIGQGRLGNYFDNTTVFLGKYIGADIFVESLLSLRYDETQQDFGGMKLEPEIGLEMQNPLFNIRMSMMLSHPENWFINDISYSLTWRWSF